MILTMLSMTKKSMWHNFHLYFSLSKMSNLPRTSIWYFIITELNSLDLRLKFPTVGICVKCQTVDLEIFLETTGEN